MIRRAADGLHHYISNKRFHPSVDIICAPIVLIIALWMAMIGPMATWITLLICLPVLLFCTQTYYQSTNRLKQTKFFLSWSISSLVVLICVFELQVVPYLEILVAENFVLISLVTLSVVLVIIIRKNDNELQTQTLSAEPIVYNYWIRSAIGHRFYMIYILSQILVSIALVYGSQLTLTTICHSRLLYQTILIPDDCSDVYVDNDIKLCYVSAIYSLLIAICIVFCLIKRLVNSLLKRQNTVQYIKLNKYFSENSYIS